MNEKIYSEDYFQARPNSRFYKGKDLLYDILFLKSIDKIINKKNEKRVRKIIFTLMLYGYYDSAFFTLLKSKKNKIFTEEDFTIVKKSIRKLIDIELPFLWRLKEKFLTKLYKLI